MNFRKIRINKKKKFLIIFVIICITILIIPIIFFISNFYNQQISNNISDWGTFGDFFGGTLNTLISLVSLIVLSYLTYLIGKQSNEENKKNNLLIRKLDAYDKLANYVPLISVNYSKLEIFTDIFLKHKEVSYLDKDRENLISDNLSESLTIYIELFYFLDSFEKMYGHLFEYDFSKISHKVLLIDGEQIKDFFFELNRAFNLNEKCKIEFNIKTYNSFIDGLSLFLNELKKELK